MARELLSYVPTLLMWAAAVYKFPRRTPPERGARFLWLTLLGLALALTVLLPPVYLTVDRLAGIPNLARLLGNGLVLVAGWTAQAYLFHLNYVQERAEPAIRRNGYLLLATLLGTSMLFSRARVDEEALDFQNRFADAPFILEYRLLYLAYLGLTLLYVVHCPGAMRGSARGRRSRSASASSPSVASSAAAMSSMRRSSS
jgi:hypothetical protein